jgi:hypothetical protein
MVLGFIHAETLKYRYIYSLTYLSVKAAFYSNAVPDYHNTKTYTENK